MYFTFDIINESITFKHNLAAELKPYMTFHSQFQLSTNKYLDNNNFIRVNRVNDYSNRFSMTEKKQVLTFFDY